MAGGSRPEAGLWPEPPQSSDDTRAHEFAKLRYQAELDEAKARLRDAAAEGVDRVKRERDREDASRAAEVVLRTAIQAAYVEVYKGSLERYQKRADFITTAAGAIGTTYTGLLALVFSVKDASRPLPARGIAPAVFLAAAFFFATVYVGFIRRATRKGHILQTSLDAEDQELRLAAFLDIMNRAVMQRAWALRAAVINLGAGVALLPLAFLRLSSNQTTVAILAVALVVLAWLIYELFSDQSVPHAPGPGGQATPGAREKPDVKDQPGPDIPNIFPAG